MVISNCVRWAWLGDDLDWPLHRILPVWRFLQLCQTDQITMVQPVMWVDPCEDPCARFTLAPIQLPCLKRHSGSLQTTYPIVGAMLVS